MEFDQIAARFWNTRRDYLVQEPLTDEALRAVEAAFGVRLPEAYVALLRIQNGGVVSDRCNAFPTAERTGWARDHVGLHELQGIGRPLESITDAASTLEDEEWGHDANAVLLTGDGHWYIALDYRAGDEPSVLWLDTELGEEVQLAPTFKAFVEGLVPTEVFDGPPADMDEPPPRRSHGETSIGGAVRFIGMDLELFEEGRRSFENTRLWPRYRCRDVLRHMGPWRTRRLRAALRAVEAAQTPDELVAAARAIEPELDRLLRPWIRKRRGGWASDEIRLRELKGR